MENNDVFVSGYFNVLHPGHMRLLKFASEIGTKLIVGVYADALVGDAAVSEKERLLAVSSIKHVDQAVLLNISPAQYIKKNQPSKVVKGWEFKNQQNLESNAVAQYGGEIIFSSGDFATTQVEEFEPNAAIYHSTINFAEDYVNRHNIKFETLANYVHSFKKLNLAVIGEIIIDKYVSCDAIGMSREDPTIVVRPASEVVFLGGAAVVAAHARGLDANVDFFSVCGDDDLGQDAKESIKQQGINACILTDDTRPTIEKMRYRANDKTMLRVNSYREHAISDELQEKLYQAVKLKINQLDAMIFSDFNYGVLPKPLVKKLIALGKKNNVLMLADSQSSSQMGRIDIYKGVTLITPTEHEARLALKNSNDGLVKIAQKMRQEVEANNIFVTLSADGLLVNANCVGIKNKSNDITDKLPALQTVVKDAAGAGDAMLITTALSLASGANIWEAAYLGSLASALQVGRVGNIPLNIKEILMELARGTLVNESITNQYKFQNTSKIIVDHQAAVLVGSQW